MIKHGLVKKEFSRSKQVISWAAVKFANLNIIIPLCFYVLNTIFYRPDPIKLFSLEIKTCNSNVVRDYGKFIKGKSVDST